MHACVKDNRWHHLCGHNRQMQPAQSRAVLCNLVSSKWYRSVKRLDLLLFDLNCTDGLIDRLVSLWSYHTTWLTLSSILRYTHICSHTSRAVVSSSEPLSRTKDLISFPRRLHNSWREIERKSALRFPVSVPLGFGSACCKRVSSSGSGKPVCMCFKLMISTCHSSAFLIIEPRLQGPKNRASLPPLKQSSHTPHAVSEAQVRPLCVCVYTHSLVQKGQKRRYLFESSLTVYIFAVLLLFVNEVIFVLVEKTCIFMGVVSL